MFCHIVMLLVVYHLHTKPSQFSGLAVPYFFYHDSQTNASNAALAMATSIHSQKREG